MPANYVSRRAIVDVRGRGLMVGVELAELCEDGAGNLGDRQKNQTLNPLSISLDPFKSDPKKIKKPDIKGSSEAS